MPQLGKTAIAILVAFAAASGAHAQRLLVVTSSMSATREAARLYMHSADMGLGAVLPGVRPLPGLEPLGRLMVAPDGKTAVVGTQEGGRRGALGQGPAQESWPQRSHICAFRTAPFAPTLGEAYASPPGHRQWVAAFVPLAEGAYRALVLGKTLDTGGNTLGNRDGRAALGSMAWLSDTETLAPSGRARLPGPPVAAATVGNDGEVAVLCQRGAAMGAVLMIAGHAERADSNTNRAPEGEEESSKGTGGLPRRVIEEGEAMTAIPVALAATQDGACVFVLLSGFAIEEPSGEVVSWLHAFDAATLDPLGAPVRLPGQGVEDGTALHVAESTAGHYRLWVATAVPGTDFAYATRLRLDAAEATVAKEAAYALTAVSDAFHLAPAPAGAAVAVAADNRIEIWPDGERTGPGTPYPHAIHVLRWTEEGLFAAEGGRVHTVNPATGAPTATVQLQSGWISDLALVPAAALTPDDLDGDGLDSAAERALGTSPISPDTDEDGVPDGSDPEPITPSPWLEVTPHIAFRGEAVGREVRALRVWSHAGARYALVQSTTMQRRFRGCSCIRARDTAPAWC